MLFLAPVTLVGPLAPPSDHWYGGLGVSLGECEAWKPQKLGGCGWTRCPQNSVLSHVAQDTARSWFWACLTQTVTFGPFLAIFGPFLGHIVELEGNKGLLVTGQSRRMCNVATVSLRLAVLSGFLGRLGPKKAVLGHKMRSFGKAPPGLAPPPQSATGEFLAQNLDLARAPPRL